MNYPEWCAEYHKIFMELAGIDSTEFEEWSIKEFYEDNYTPLEAFNEEIQYWYSDTDEGEC